VAFGFTRTLTIDHTQCGGSDSTNFPVLVSITAQTYIKTTAFGGNVQNLHGYDINFFSDANLTTLLKWEVDFYDQVAGTLQVWVQIPTVSHSANTLFYMAYGDPTISTFQGGALGAAWNSNFVTVLHLANGTVLSLTDSTSNAVNFSNSGALAAAGQIDGAASCTSPAFFQTTATTPILAGTAITLEFWLNYTTQVNADQVALSFSSTTPMNIFVNSAAVGGSSLAVMYDGSNNPNSVSFAKPSTGSWHHWVIVFDHNGLNTGVTVYIDGSSVSVTPVGTTHITGGWSRANMLAMGQGSGLDNLAGTIDEIRFSKVNLGADWILTTYNTSNNPNSFTTIGAEVTLIQAVIIASSTTTANWTTINQIAGSITGSATVTAPIACAIYSAITGTATVTSTLAGTGALATAITGTASVTAGIGSSFGAAITGTATVTSTLAGSGNLAAAIAGSATFTGTLKGSGSIAAVAAATATVTGNLTGTGTLASSITGQATVTSTLAGTGAMAAVINAQATVTATLGGFSLISSTITGAATVTSAINAVALIAAVISSRATVTAATAWSPAVVPFPYDYKPNISANNMVWGFAEPTGFAYGYQPNQGNNNFGYDYVDGED